MSDDKNNIMNDDEYQFPKDEYIHQSTSTTADTSDHAADMMSDEKIVENKAGFKQVFTRFPFLKKKKFYFAMAFAIVILIGIQAMHGGHKTKVIMQKSASAVKVQHPSTQILNQLDSIKSSQVSNNDTLSSLQNNISDLKSKLTQAASDNTQLAQSVAILTAQTKLLAQQVNVNTKKLTVKPKKVVHHKPAYHPKPITYDVKAIVPGRAWIISSKNRSYTVSIGDKIPQYGRVKSIDDNAGRIYTTSGKIIAYGPNDS